MGYAAAATTLKAGFDGAQSSLQDHQLLSKSCTKSTPELQAVHSGRTERELMCMSYRNFWVSSIDRHVWLPDSLTEALEHGRPHAVGTEYGMIVL